MRASRRALATSPYDGTGTRPGPPARETSGRRSAVPHGDGRRSGLPAQVDGGVLGGQRPREQVPLPDVAAVAAQPDRLGLVLDALAVDLHAQRLAEPDHAA